MRISVSGFKNVHKLTIEDNAKGGSVKSIAKKLGRRKTCNNSCPIFETCPFSYIGQKHNICYLNNGKQSFRNKIIRLMEGGREDLIKVASDVLSDMIRIADIEDDSNIKSQEKVINAIEKFHNMMYGTKHNIEHSGKIDIKAFKEWMENHNGSSN